MVSATEPVNLTNCDREPIHVPGSIQPHGAMLVCEPGSLQVQFLSRNTAALIGWQGDLAPDMSLAGILGEAAAHDLRNAAAKASMPGLAGVVMGMRIETSPREFDAKIHTHEDRTFVEIEPIADDGRSAQQALDLTQTLISRIALESQVPKIAEAGALLVRAMLGYDRVMVYRFLHNGAGRVIAEARSPLLGSFLHQHFPASDIPYQARRLYLLNPIRMISDAYYDPVPLDPPVPAGKPPVDMSFAQLRSVSPIHCEYLRNMKVSASLSISIVVDGKLWGLISCHHDTPRVTPMALRIGAELFGQFFSLQLAAAERREAMLAASEARARLDGIVAGLSAEGAIEQNLIDRLSDFSLLMPCHGVGLWMNGRWSSYGSVPEPEVARALMDIAADAAPRHVWATHELAAHGLRTATPMAGALTIPLSSALGHYLIFFRDEEAHGIEWAGEPVKTLVQTEAGDRLTPRGSFETWRQEVRGRSTPWTDADRSVAEAIGTYLRDVILRQSEATEEERARTEQRRRILNAELNHRVKNIISLVTSIALQTGATVASVAEYSAALEGRLRALAFAHDQSQGSAGGGDLAALVEAEASLHRYGGAPDRVVATGPRIRLDDQAFSVLALVVHEMMTNAAKYGALSVPEGRLEIGWRILPQGGSELRWVERGGPVVTRPSRDGFGTKLIRSTIEYDLRGSAEVTYAPGGVEARFIVPAAHVALAADAAPPAAVPDLAEAPLAGFSVLVVEDQGLIAMDTERTIRALGAADVRLAPTAEDALLLLESFEPDAALLDFNLGKGTAEPVADFLIRRGVPFVFTTGYSDNVMIPARLRQVPVVRKPINRNVLSRQLAVARAAAGR